MNYSIRDEDYRQLKAILEQKDNLSRVTPKVLRRIYTLLWEEWCHSRKWRWDVFKKYHEWWLQYALVDKSRSGRPWVVWKYANRLIRDMFYNRMMSYKEIQEHFKERWFEISVDALRKRCNRHDNERLKMI